MPTPGSRRHRGTKSAISNVPVLAKRRICAWAKPLAVPRPPRRNSRPRGTFEPRRPTTTGVKTASIAQPWNRLTSAGKEARIRMAVEISARILGQASGCQAISTHGSINAGHERTYGSPLAMDSRVPCEGSISGFPMREFGPSPRGAQATSVACAMMPTCRGRTGHRDCATTGAVGRVSADADVRPGGGASDGSRAHRA